MSLRALTALPVYNEARHLEQVLGEVRKYCADVLVVDDGSTDGTAEILQRTSGIQVVTHQPNQGYGAALRSAFQYALEHSYDVLVTIDCDGQHEPRRIPLLIDALEQNDVVSGSRYLARFPGDSEPPPERRQINRLITDEVNRRVGLKLTDAFCGFKAYRVASLRKVQLTERGYAMPLEFWVQAVANGLKIVEFPVPLIYLDEKRSFGGVLDNAHTRLQVYHLVLDKSLAAVQRHTSGLWSGTLCAAAAE